MILLTSLLPVAVLLLLCVPLTTFTIKLDSVARHLCRTQLLSAQKLAAESLNQLISLNPLAESLRREAKLAEAAASKSRHPAAQAWLAAVRARQLALRVRQLALINRAKLAPQSGANRITLQLNAKQFQTRQTEIAQFPLNAKPTNSLTPDYTPQQSMTRMQTAGVAWSLEPLLALSSDLRRSSFLQDLLKPIRLNGECRSSIFFREGKWQEGLSADKS